MLPSHFFFELIQALFDFKELLLCLHLMLQIFNLSLKLFLLGIKLLLLRLRLDFNLNLIGQQHFFRIVEHVPLVSEIGPVILWSNLLRLVMMTYCSRLLFVNLGALARAATIGCFVVPERRLALLVLLLLKQHLVLLFYFFLDFHLDLILGGQAALAVLSDSHGRMVCSWSVGVERLLAEGACRPVMHRVRRRVRRRRCGHWPDQVRRAVLK